MDPAETAIAEDADHISSVRTLFDMFNDGIDVGKVGANFSAGLDVLHQALRIEAFARRDLLQSRHFGNYHPISVFERRRELLLENISASGVRARLKNRPNPLAWKPHAQGPQGFANGGWMMAEIIDDGDPAADPANLHSTFNALEGVKRRLNLRIFQTAMFGAGNDGQGVAHIEFAEKVEPKFEAGNFELRRGGSQVHIERAHRIGFAKAKTLHRTMRDVQQRSNIWIVAVGQQETIAGNQVDQALKGSLDRGQIFENVGMIKFQIVDDGNLRQVMDELAALIEKGGIVFVPFNDKPFALGEARALS